jgi:hypothetical protein
MQDTIWHTIAATHWWIFVLFFFCAWNCYIVTKPHRVSLNNLYMPAFSFIGMSALYLTMVMTLRGSQFDYNLMLTWCGMVLLGTTLSYLHYYALKVKAQPDAAIIVLPGSYLPMLYFIVAISVKLYFRIQINFHLAQLLNPEHYRVLATIYGCLSGLCLGRVVYAVRCIKRGPYSLENISQIGLRPI